MNRMPTPRAALYAWHTRAMESVSLRLQIDVNPLPECGWFKRRLVKGGVFVPARIWMFQPTDDETGELVGDEVFQCEVNGRYADPQSAWSWLCGNPISEQMFNFMTADAAWSADYAPHEPKANPRDRVDWSRIPTPQF